MKQITNTITPNMDVKGWLNKFNTNSTQKIGAKPQSKGSGKQIVAVLADWCPHCTSFEPQFKRLVAGNPEVFSIAKEVNGKKPRQWEDLFDHVNGFPSVVVVKKGQIAGGLTPTETAKLSRKIKTKVVKEAPNFKSTV